MRRSLIVGFGDIAQLVVALLAGRCRIYAPARDTWSAHLVAARAKGGSLPQRFVHI